MDRTHSAIPRTYFSQIAKIIEGAANADYQKVCAYAEQLSQQLDADGESESAKRIRQSLGKGKARKLALARAGHLTQADTAHVPVDSESRLSTADEELFLPENVDVFLAGNAHKLVNEFIQFYQIADQLIANGVGFSSSMLLYGPPGCGKTQVARYISAQLKLPLITGRTDGLISSYLGSTAKNLRLLFEHAMSRPCVLFLDEFDALAKMRDDSRELGELKRVVISLLQNIDAMGKDHVLLAATNHSHLLDPAVWRRFSYKVNIGLPDEETRAKIITKVLGRYGDTDLIEILAAITDGISGAALRHGAEDSIRRAVISRNNELDKAATIDAFLKLNEKESEHASDSPTDQIKLLRRRDPKKFTQERLARIYDLSQSQVCKLLKGN